MEEASNNTPHKALRYLSTGRPISGELLPEDRKAIDDHIKLTSPFVTEADVYSGRRRERQITDGRFIFSAIGVCRSRVKPRQIRYIYHRCENNRRCKNCSEIGGYVVLPSANIDD